MSQEKRVVIVDDDADYVGAVTALLETAGYRVRSAGNSRDGLELIKAWLPGLVLLDVMMTERTEGFFTLQELRRTPEIQNTPVVVVSSIYADCPAFRVSPEAGWLPAEQFLPKPVDSGRLLELVKEHFAKSWSSEVNQPDEKMGKAQ